MDRSTTDVKQDLENLLSATFDAKVCFYNSIETLRDALLKTAEVRRLRNDLHKGVITEAAVRNFVAKGIEQWTPGYQSNYNFAFAALAVVLEQCSEHYAEEYLLDLARIKHAEMSPANRIARHCAKLRLSFINSLLFKSFDCDQNLDDGEYTDEGHGFLYSQHLDSEFSPERSFQTTDHSYAIA